VDVPSGSPDSATRIRTSRSRGVPTPMRRTIIIGLALMAPASLGAGVGRPARAAIAYALKDLGVLGGNRGHFSLGYAVNASGRVVGYLRAAGDMVAAFPSGPGGGALKGLGTLGGDLSEGFAVNASGQVTGESAGHAFLSGPDGGALKDLGTLGGDLSTGYAI